MANVLVQIALLDIVFSLDSVITAVGMSQHLEIMIAANVLALGVMVFTSKRIGDFVERHPTIKMLALSFLIMIGLVLVADASGLHIPKRYIYFAMAFSVAVEMLNLRSHSKKAQRKESAIGSPKRKRESGKIVRFPPCKRISAWFDCSRLKIAQGSTDGLHYIVPVRIHTARA